VSPLTPPRIWPFYSPDEVVFACERWFGLVCRSLQAPHCAEALELGQVAMMLASTADAARSGIDTQYLKGLYKVLREAEPGPHETYDLTDSSSYAWFIGRATDGMHETRSWAAQQLQARITNKRFSHAKDFTSITWGGKKYEFKKGRQAACIRALWSAWEEDGSGLGEETIAEEIGSDAKKLRLAHVFRGHPAFGTIIKPTGRGVFSLVPPESSEKHTS
jgi:hypothetical protein